MLPYSRCSPLVNRRARGPLRRWQHTIPRGILLIHVISSRSLPRPSSGFPSKSNIQRPSHGLQHPPQSALTQPLWTYPPPLSALLTPLQPHQHPCCSFHSLAKCDPTPGPLHLSLPSAWNVLPDISTVCSLKGNLLERPSWSTLNKTASPSPSINFVPALVLLHTIYVLIGLLSGSLC